MRRRSRMVFNARPHPSPLPQEREKRCPRFGDADLLVLVWLSPRRTKRRI